MQGFVRLLRRELLRCQRRRREPELTARVASKPAVLLRFLVAV